MSLIDLGAASGEELDKAGAMYGLPRNYSESDNEYRQRIANHELFFGRPFLDPAEYASVHMGKYAGLLLAKHMSMRDYFAAKAMEIAYAGHAPEYLAEVAYQMADAMLAERAK